MSEIGTISDCYKLVVNMLTKLYTKGVKFMFCVTLFLVSNIAYVLVSMGACSISAQLSYQPELS